MNLRHTVIDPLLQCVPWTCIAIALLTATQFAGAQQRSSWKTSHLERAKTTSVSADEALAAAERTATNIAKWRQSEDVLSRRRELRTVKGLTMDQIIAYDALSDQHNDLKVHWPDNSGLPIFITGSALYSSPLYLRNEFEQASLEFFAYKFLDAYKDLLRIESPKNEFAVRTITRSEETGTVQVRMIQTFKGIDVWAKEIVIQFNEQGQVNLFAGRTESSSPKTENPSPPTWWKSVPTSSAGGGTSSTPVPVQSFASTMHPAPTVRQKRRQQTSSGKRAPSIPISTRVHII